MDDYKTNPSMFRNNPVMFVICILFMIVAAVGLLVRPEGWWVFIPLFFTGLIYLLVWWLIVSNITLTITNDLVIKRTGIFSKHISEVYHNDINYIQVDQNLLQRILDAGNVSIASAATGGIEIRINGIPHPETVQGILQDHHPQYQGSRSRWRSFS